MTLGPCYSWGLKAHTSEGLILQWGTELERNSCLTPVFATSVNPRDRTSSLALSGFSFCSEQGPLNVPRSCPVLPNTLSHPTACWEGNMNLFYHGPCL